MAMIYQPGQAWETPPAILAIGDSWCWYPKNNLLQALIEHPGLGDPYRNIQMLGYNGATLEEFVTGRYNKQFHAELKHLHYYSAIIISGAGNDAVDYGLALRPDCTGRSAADCIDTLLLQTFRHQITRAMCGLISSVLWAAKLRRQHLDIFLHGYDYPVPDGRGFTLAGLSVAGPWLQPRLDAAKVARSEQRQVCRLIMDSLSRAIQGLADNKTVHYIDSRGTLSSSADYQQDWDNEMHPTAQGFARIVDSRWMPVLSSRGY